MACEGFLKWIILLPSWFECSGCVQSMLAGTEGVLLCNQEICWCLYRGCQSGYLWCCFYLQWKEDFVAERALWFLTFWSSGITHTASSCQFGPADAEKQPALAVLLSVVAVSQWCCYPKCPGLWSLTSRGWAVLGSSSCCEQREFLGIPYLFSNSLAFLHISSKPGKEVRGCQRQDGRATLTLLTQ